MSLVPNVKMCDKAVHTYHSTIQFVPECYDLQEICIIGVNRCCFCIYLYSCSIKNSKNVRQCCFWRFLYDSILDQ